MTPASIRIISLTRRLRISGRPRRMPAIRASRGTCTSAMAIPAAAATAASTAGFGPCAADSNLVFWGNESCNRRRGLSPEWFGEGFGFKAGLFAAEAAPTKAAPTNAFGEPTGSQPKDIPMGIITNGISQTGPQRVLDDISGDCARVLAISHSSIVKAGLPQRLPLAATRVVDRRGTAGFKASHQVRQGAGPQLYEPVEMIGHQHVGQRAGKADSVTGAKLGNGEARGGKVAKDRGAIARYRGEQIAAPDPGEAVGTQAMAVGVWHGMDVSKVTAFAAKDAPTQIGRNILKLCKRDRRRGFSPEWFGEEFGSDAGLFAAKAAPTQIGRNILKLCKRNRRRGFSPEWFGEEFGSGAGLFAAKAAPTEGSTGKWCSRRRGFSPESEPKPSHSFLPVRARFPSLFARSSSCAF